ncbi:MAG: hypothetical protein AB7F88_01655 [Pyrinomonadaceae bacterium]
MNDLKNIFLAWASTGSPVLAVLLADPGVTILSAIILPVVFFAVGKTIDVLLQIHFRKRNDTEDKR